MYTLRNDRRHSLPMSGTLIMQHSSLLGGLYAPALNFEKPKNAHIHATRRVYTPDSTRDAALSRPSWSPAGLTALRSASAVWTTERSRTLTCTEAPARQQHTSRGWSLFTQLHLESGKQFPAGGLLRLSYSFCTGCGGWFAPVQKLPAIQASSAMQNQQAQI